MDSRPTPGTTGKTAADTYATIAKFLELELDSIQSVKDSMLASLDAAKTGASATVDALLAQASAMRQQAIGAIISGVTSLATTAGSFAAPKLTGTSGQLKINKDTQVNIGKYQENLQAKLPQPASVGGPVGAGGTPAAPAAAAPAATPTIKTEADFIREHADKMTSTKDTRFTDDLADYGPVDAKHIEAAHNLSVTRMKELKKEAAILEQKNEMIRNIGTQTGQGLARVSETGGQFAAAATKADEAKAEQSKQIQAALAEQMRQGVETLKRILDTYLQAETALQQLLKTTNQR